MAIEDSRTSTFVTMANYKSGILSYKYTQYYRAIYIIYHTIMQDYIILNFEKEIAVDISKTWLVNEASKTNTQAHTQNILRNEKPLLNKVI